VPLDRKDIEKKDFPTARRGYAQDAVDAHLRALADEVEALKKKADAKPAQESMASGASEQVRAIVEAAESSAAGIKAQAELEARTLREDATAEGREHVARVSKASDALAERVQEMQAELKRLTDGLAAQLGRPEAAPAVVAATPAEPIVVAAKPDEDDDIADHAVDAAAGAEPSEPEPEDEPEPEVEAEEPEPEAAKAAAADDDSEGARLIALNMALNGTPRDETDRYLSENFDLADREGLLDEVYAKAAP
jgi:DivIVA domain-containing protein